jgi:XTP/dITP diphosphohydrolase
VKLAYFNTLNENKIREFRHLFPDEQRFGVLRVPIVEILDADLEAVVKAKAAAAYQASRQPVIVEHVGLYVDYLNGFPGALVKPLWKSLGQRLCELLPPGAPRTMKARSTVCFCDGRRRLILHAELDGDLAPAARGSGGFHWDPIFIPKGETRTLAELPLEEKLRISPAGRAYEKLRQALGC